MAIICNKKHYQSNIIIGHEVTNDDPLPHMSQYQMRRYVRKLMLNAARDVFEKFQRGNKVYVIDADAEVEGLLVNNVQRQQLRSEAHDLCNRINEME